MKRICYCLIVIIFLFFPLIMAKATISPNESLSECNLNGSYLECVFYITSTSDINVAGLSVEFELENLRYEGIIDTGNFTVNVIDSSTDSVTFRFVPTSGKISTGDTYVFKSRYSYIGALEDCAIYYNPINVSPKCYTDNTNYYDDQGNKVTKTEYEQACNPKCQYVNGYYYNNLGAIVTKTQYEQACNPKCEIKDGKYYNSGGAEVTKTNYEQDCNPHCKIQDGKYYNNSGAEVTKTEYEAACNPKCEYKNGKYYNNLGAEVTQAQYNVACNIENGSSETPVYYCEYKDNKYYDSKGNVVIRADYLKDCFSCKIDGTKYYDKNGVETSKETHDLDCNPKCTVSNGKYYDRVGAEVDAKEYDKQCNKHICEIGVDGTYYDKDGNETTEATYNDQCKDKIICKVDSGKYYDNEGKETDEITYSQKCLINICKKVGDLYYGKSGKEVNRATYEDECIKKHYCEIIDGVYYDDRGTITTEDKYTELCKVKNPNTGASIPMTISIGFIVSGTIAIMIARKKRKIFNI